MKHLKYVSFLLFTISLLFVSCNKIPIENPVNRTDGLPVEFEFILLDTLGNEKTEFNKGENFIFSFQVINNGSEDLYIENFLSNNDFFRVYKSNMFLRDFGIPYQAYVKISGFGIPANDTLKIEYPWKANIFWNEEYPILSNENRNDDLPKGEFFTEFSQSFKVADIQIDTLHFKINFTVK